MKILFCLFLISTSFAHEEEGGGPNIGKGKGVEAYSEHDGFKLSKEAVKRLGIETKAINFPVCDLKGIQIVSALDRKEIFVLRGESYKSVEPKCAEVKLNDRGVIKGADFLRVIEMDLTSGDDEHHEDEEKSTSDKSKESDHD
jgi:hypothetical protein